MKQNRLIVRLFCSMLLAVTTVSCAVSKDSMIVHENTGTGTNSCRETEGSDVDSGKTPEANKFLTVDAGLPFYGALCVRDSIPGNRQDGILLVLT